MSMLSDMYCIAQDRRYWRTRQTLDGQPKNIMLSAYTPHRPVITTSWIKGLVHLSRTIISL